MYIIYYIYYNILIYINIITAPYYVRVFHDSYKYT